MSTVFTDLEEVDAQIAVYKEALKFVASGREYQMSDGRTLTMPDLSEIRRTLNWLRRERAALAGTAGPKILRGRPKR